MMEKIIAMYEENRKNEAAYDAAEAANDQAGMEAERARHHELCQEARDNGKDFCFMLRLYTSMKERGNVVIDLNDVHDNQVEEVAGILHRFGVKEFTFSSTWSSAISAMWEFCQHGFIMGGMIQINSESQNFHTGEWKKAPAIVFTVNE